MVKKQHYIPEALLILFASNAKLFEALLESKKIYPTTPRDTMCEAYTYEDTNLEKNTVEKFFEKIEDEVIPLAKNIVNLLQQENKDLAKVKQLLEDLMPNFLVFYYRSGALLTEFSSIDKKDKIPSLSKKILNKPYIFSLAETITNNYNFAFIQSNEEFLLSDQFVSTAALGIKSRFTNISNRHIGLKDTLLLVPLSSSYYAAYWNSEKDFLLKPNQINSLDIESLKLFNHTIINNSYIKCVSSSESSLLTVLDDYQMKFPSQIYMGFLSGLHRGAIKKKEVFFYKEDEEAFELLEFANFQRYRDLGRNDPCACGSKKKFKHCHRNSFDKIKRVIAGFGSRPYSIPQQEYGIPGVATFEKPVEEWSGYSEKKKIEENPNT